MFLFNELIIRQQIYLFQTLYDYNVVFLTEEILDDFSIEKNNLRNNK